MAIFRFESAKPKKKDVAMAHYRYICREGQYANKNDLEHLVEKNIPSEYENAQDYFKTAVKSEEANSNIMRSFIVTLPYELPDQENKKLIEEFCKKEFGENPYLIAIHNPNGGNPHAHIILSERTPDGIKRSKEQFFKKYRHKNIEKGGARKNPKYVDKNFFKEIRKSWEIELNQKLEKYGLEKVDCRKKIVQVMEELSKDEKNENLSQDEIHKLAVKQLRDLKKEKGIRKDKRLKKDIHKSLRTMKVTEIKDRLISYQLKWNEKSNQIRGIDSQIKNIESISINKYTKGKLYKDYTKKITLLRKQKGQLPKNSFMYEKIEKQIDDLVMEKENYINQFKNNEVVKKMNNEILEGLEKKRNQLMEERRHYNHLIKVTISQTAPKDLEKILSSINRTYQKRHREISRISVYARSQKNKREQERLKVKKSINQATKNVMDKVGKFLNRKEEKSGSVNMKIRIKEIEQDREEEIGR